MTQSDQGFPIIQYQKNKTPKEWGRIHGESYASAIKELAQIRKDLMLSKSPRLQAHLEPLANEQFKISKEFCPYLCDEMIGIAEGSGLGINDIVILNNYTDFRDIELNEEGCSTIYVNSRENVIAGQTWDMHSSAKDYLCTIDVPEDNDFPGAVVLSLVGCLGLMGFNSQKCLIGVNNINTKNARAGLIWPLLVRKALHQKDINKMRDILIKAPVTSGHNYIISDPSGGEHWEITPTEKICYASHLDNNLGSAFHTNHCLTKEVANLEVKNSQSSTTYARYDILKDKVKHLENKDDMINLLKSHEGHPKSICSHFEMGSQDPSMTCGGGVADMNSGEFIVWRGGETEDKNFKQYNTIINSNDNNFTYKK